MGEGAISGVVRFLCHVLLFYYAFTSINHYNFVKDHMKVLLAPPLGSKVFVAEVFSGPIGIIAFIWNFILWIPTIYSEGGQLFAIGVVDAVITGFIIAALVLQASFIGFNHTQCAQLRPDAAPTSHLIFFQRVVEIDGKDKDIGETTCQGYYTRWYIGLVIAILYAISAISNILIGSHSHNRNRRSSHCLLAPIHAVIDVIKAVADGVFFFLPARVQNALFFADRYARRWFHHKGSKTKQNARNAYALFPRRPHHRGGEEKGLHCVLAQGEVVGKIAQHLHYVDVVNLSLVSRGIREVVFPRQDTSAADERHARYYSCQGHKKYDCWACGIQICDECSKSTRCSNSTVSYHISLCAATCTRCYYKSILKGSNMRYPCQCTTDGRTKDAYTPRSYYWATNHNPKAPRLVCRDCYDMTADEILALRERRDEARYSNLTQQPLSCSGCSESLPRKGPRWWVCSKCKKECRSKCHSEWSQRLEA